MPTTPGMSSGAGKSAWRARQLDTAAGVTPKWLAMPLPLTIMASLLPFILDMVTTVDALDNFGIQVVPALMITVHGHSSHSGV